MAGTEPAAGERQKSTAVRRLFGCWILLAAVLIEFYARRYGYLPTPLLPHGLLALLAISALLVSPTTFERLAPRYSSAFRLWPALLLATAFLFALDRRFQLVHVGAVCALLLVTLGVLWPVLRLPRSFWRPSLALTLATVNFLLILYYLVLLVGRETWNQIVSRELLYTYTAQLPELISALPVPTWIPWAIAAAVLGMLFLAYWWAAPRIAGAMQQASEDWRRALPSKDGTSRRGLVTPLLVVAAVTVAGPWVFRTAAYGDSPDPLVTTFFVDQDRPGGLHNSFVADPADDARDLQVARTYKGPDRLSPKTLVLITIDALRADQMNVYGHERRNTPYLTQLYRDGKLTRFDNVFSICTESLCGLLGIHGSRYWHQLGTRNFAIADVLKRLGYRTHFLLGGDHSNFYGLRAFYGTAIDQYRDGSLAAGYMNDDSAILDWLTQMDVTDGAPRFVFIHLMSVHMIGKRLDPYRVWYGTAAGAGQSNYVNKYHDGILQADAFIRQIFGILERKGLMAHAIVAITADHGEMLGEQGRIGHGGPPLDPAVRVPLLIYDSEGYRYPARTLVSTIDVAPTLLQRIGAPIPAHWEGKSLASGVQRDFSLMQAGSAYAVVGRFGTELFKYYYDEEGRERLVRLSPDGTEHAIEPSDTRQVVLVGLRAEFDRQRPQLRRAVTARQIRAGDRRPAP